MSSQEDDALRLVLINDAVERAGQRAKVRVRIKHPDGSLVDSAEVDAIVDESGIVQLGDYKPQFRHRGLYQIEYAVAPA